MSLVAVDFGSVVFFGMLLLIFVNMRYDFADAVRPDGVELLNCYVMTLVPLLIVLRNAGTDPVLTWAALGMFVLNLGVVYQTKRDDPTTAAEVSEP